MASHNKTFFIECTDFSLRIARVVHGAERDLITDMRESSPKTPEEARAFLYEFTKEKPGTLIRAYCAVYPRGRILRDLYFEGGPKNLDLPAMLQEASNQFEIDLPAHHIGILNTDDGTRYQQGRIQKKFLVCGAPRKELQEAQDFLVKAGVYPLRLELGSVATIGMLMAHLRMKEAKHPVLFLEMDEEISHVFVISGNQLESAKPIPFGLNSMVAGVRKELGLKDAAAARRLFFSDTFDFREMGSRLIERLLRELQSMIGFYEIQNGQSISHLLCGLLPMKLDWLNDTFAASLGISRLPLDLGPLLEYSKLAMEETAPSFPASHGLLGLMMNQEVPA